MGWRVWREFLTFWKTGQTHFSPRGEWAWWHQKDQSRGSKGISFPWIGHNGWGFVSKECQGTLLFQLDQGWVSRKGDWERAHHSSKCWCFYDVFTVLTSYVAPHHVQIPPKHCEARKHLFGEVYHNDLQLGLCSWIWYLEILIYFHF